MAVPAFRVARPSLRLMPLGGSITYGVGSSDRNGYRRLLREMLASDGYDISFVGSRKAGTMKNGENEGWRGFRIDQVKNMAMKSVPSLKPNIIAINAGSNDCIQDFDLGHTGERVEDLVECLWGAVPGSTIILSTLLANQNTELESRIVGVNKQIAELVKRKAAENKRVVLAEMHGSDGPCHEDLTDGTHPNDQGYEKMARIWFKSIEEARLQGFL